MRINNYKGNFTRHGHRSRSGYNTEYARCVICNSVNRSEIADEDSDFFSGGFYDIESYGKSGAPAFICYECEGSHRDVMTEWEISDELDLEEGEEM